MRTFQFLFLAIICSVASVHSHERRSYRSLSELLDGQVLHSTTPASVKYEFDASSVSVNIGDQDGLKEADAIQSLPGQPSRVDFNQYSGYVTVDPIKGRALFYYFVESPHNSSTKPLVLWLTGGPGCSSLGGAMMELGPFRVSRDGETLYRNQYAWNNEANIIFLESPAGVGFSYSNTTTDYDITGDNTTAIDSYSFLRNWLERFPEYKTRDFYITGEGYAGHYVPQLAQMILHMNQYTNQTSINLRRIAVGNAYMDNESSYKGSVDYFWSYSLISDETYMGLLSSCNFSSPDARSPECSSNLEKASESVSVIYPYNLYYPICSSQIDNSLPFDPCSRDYITSYLNMPQVQRALHANVTALPYPWASCSGIIPEWKDRHFTVLPIIKELMESGISVWMYSGDTDAVEPVTATRHSINKLGTTVKIAWYPWYIGGEVGGYAVGYQNLTFATVRAGGHSVPSYQPARALALFTAFINDQLPPSS